jgi:AraC family transcriptional regulator, exoenzyme S synthesis regulatory protein ExsA
MIKGNDHLTPIHFSCHFAQFREGEQFVQKHALSMTISGEVELNDGEKALRFMAGDMYLANKDHLLKFVKYPPANGEYKSISIYFDQSFLLDFSREYGYKAEEVASSSAFIPLSDSLPLKSFMQSMLVYEEMQKDREVAGVLQLKLKEPLLLLLLYKPSLKDALFDFSEPYRIDLETFMEKNYHFNVQLERFAYLTGRSLSTFKRDFEKIFRQTPSRWLLHRRLKEAYELITRQGKKASDIYLDLGFEDLSHFSYVFKKEFGVAPSRVE